MEIDLGTFFAAIEQWAWIGWLVLIALFLVIEMLTLEFTFLMLALGSALGLFSGALGVPSWGQAILAAFSAILLIFLLKPPLLRRLRRGGDPARSNVDALIGLSGFVSEEITAHAGQVRLNNGDTWTARSTERSTIPSGASIVVDEIQGATAIVRTTQS